MNPRLHFALTALKEDGPHSDGGMLTKTRLGDFCRAFRETGMIRAVHFGNGLHQFSITDLGLRALSAEPA